MSKVVAQRLRQELFDHLLHVRLAALEQFTSGEHVHRLTRSCGRIGEVYVSEHLLPLAMNAILLIGTLAAMTALHWRLSLLALLAFPLAYLLTRKTRGRAQSLYRDQSDLLEAGQSYLHQVSPDYAPSGPPMPNPTKRDAGASGSHPIATSRQEWPLSTN